MLMKPRNLERQIAYNNYNIDLLDWQTAQSRFRLYNTQLSTAVKDSAQASMAIIIIDVIRVVVLITLGYLLLWAN
jgi:hypothetical protein